MLLTHISFIHLFLCTNMVTTLKFWGYMRHIYCVHNLHLWFVTTVKYKILQWLRNSYVAVEIYTTGFKMCDLFI